MKRQIRGVGVGTVSLVMIFSVLCLTVFSMLTLSTANAERIMAEKTSAFVQGYYQADSQATKIRGQIMASAARGAVPESIDGIEITREMVQGRAIVSYACPINQVQEIFVQFRLDSAEKDILIWETRPAVDWEADDSMTVWDGTFE